MLRCLLVDDDDFSRALIEHYVDQHDALELTASCSTAIAAANVLQDTPIDVIFLDVEMPEMTGLQLAQSLTHLPSIVIVSSKEHYAVDAFDLEVTDYLLKPVEYPRFLKAVDRVLREQEASDEASEGSLDGDGLVFLKTSSRLVKLDLREVKWIEAQGDYVLIHTPAKEHLINDTMKGLTQKLPASHFLRVHRSFIVRLDQISDVDDTTLVIERKVIPIGASYRRRLLAHLNTL